MSDGKRVLITGGSGFIGANLARELLRQRHSVEFLLREGHSNWRIRDINAKSNIADLTDKEAVRHVLRSAKADWIFHLAPHGETSGLGTSNLIQAAHDTGLEAFISTGSSTEYATGATPSRSFPVCTLHLESVFGPFDEPTRLVPALAMHGLKGTLPPLADPSTPRDFVYVDDAIAAFIAAAKNASRFPGELFDVGTGIQTTLGEAVAAARREFRVTEEPIWNAIPDRRPDTGAPTPDHTKTARDLGWQPKTSFAQGLARFGRWLKFDRERFEFYENKLLGLT